MLASVGVGLRLLGIIVADIDKPPLAGNVSGRPICYNGGLGDNSFRNYISLTVG